MLKTLGIIMAHDEICCKIYEDLKNRNGSYATLDEFMVLVDKYAEELPEEKRNAFKGDMLEILAELFFNAFKNDPRVGLSDYTPIAIENDYGVDGYGINAAGKKCAVQIKYRSNPNVSITYGDIARTYTSAVLYNGIPLSGDDCIYIFTTSYFVTPPNFTVFDRMLRVISHKIISQEINNNINFWNNSYVEIEETLKQRGVI